MLSSCRMKQTNNNIWCIRKGARKGFWLNKNVCLAWQSSGKKCPKCKEKEENANNPIQK